MGQALAKQGNVVTLLAPKKKFEEETDVEDVYEFYNVEKCFDIVWKPYIGMLVRPFVYAMFVVFYLMRSSADLVYGRDLLGCFMSSIIGRDTIYEAHDLVWEGSKLKELFFRIMVNQSNFIKLVVISDVLKGYYVRKYGDAIRNIEVAHDGADSCKDKKKLSTWPGRKNVLQVGYVGHLYKGKGVEIVEQLSREMPGVDFHLIGGLEQDIKYWKARANGSNAFFHGFVPQSELSKYINCLDVCLLPNQKKVFSYGSNSRSRSIGEFTSPLKLFDYMSHSKAIIASDLPVLREVLNDEISILVESDNVKKWCSAIQKMHSSALRELYAERALEVFEMNYSWEARSKGLLRRVNA